MKRRHVINFFFAPLLSSETFMNHKLILVLFAVGLGSSIAYARPPGGYGCYAECIREYRSCIAQPHSDRAACAREKNACIAFCNQHR